MAEERQIASLIESHFEELKKRGEKQIPVSIEKRVKDGQYFIATRIGDLVHKVAIDPENKREWDRKMPAQVAAALDSTSAGNAQPEFIAGFGDLFMDYNDLSVMYSTSVANRSDARRSYEIQRLGAFAPSRLIIESTWCFPVVPAEEVKYYHLMPDMREWPVMVRTPPAHFYPNDFGPGVARYWRESKWGHQHNVYLVQKARYSELDPEDGKYHGPSGGRQPTFQVPGWMIAHFRPMMVKDISFSKNEVVFYQRGNDHIRASIDEARPKRGRNFVSLDKLHQLMAVAMLDLYFDYPQQMRDFYDPTEERATKEYMAQMESSDGSASGSTDESRASAATASAARSFSNEFTAPANSPPPPQAAPSAPVTTNEPQAEEEEPIESQLEDDPTPPNRLPLTVYNPRGRGQARLEL